MTKYLLMTHTVNVLLGHNYYVHIINNYDPFVWLPIGLLPSVLPNYSYVHIIINNVEWHKFACAGLSALPFSGIAVMMMMT